MSSHALSGASHLSAVALQCGVMRRVQENSRPVSDRVLAFLCVCVCNNARARATLPRNGGRELTT